MAQALALHGGYRVQGFDADENIRERFSSITTDNENIQIYDDMHAAVKNADIVILATPIDKFGSILQGLDGHIRDGAIVTDVGSGKQKSIEEINRNLPAGASYIPVHPLVGAAGVGPETGRADMYQDQPIIVVPGGAEKEQAVIEQMWRDMGGRPEEMSAFAHDRLYGTISHFEHVIAFAEVLAGEDLNHVAYPR